MGIRLAIILALLPAAHAYEPTSSYEARHMEGWTVRVSSVLKQDHPEMAAQAEQLLGVKLYEIARVVPQAAVEKLRAVTIWLEYQDHDILASYHPSAEWLGTHGLNPDKARSVEIGSAADFLSQPLEQPWVLLHELAHAYHDQVIGRDNAEIIKAYDAAVASHRYEKVLHISGSERRHYALTDVDECFAESSEAFFGTNDFYPFVRVGLRKYDPVMYELLKKFWGVE